MTELSWIDYLKKHVKNGKGVIAGIGDDCAYVKLDKQRCLLKSDLFIEDRHFKRGKVDLKTIGARAAGRVLSDFAACAGKPKFIGVSVGLPGWVKDDGMKDLLAGVLYHAKKYKYSLVGGDTSRSDKLFLDVWGVGETDKCVLRSTAKTGDYIFLTGKLGARPFDRIFEPRIKEAIEITRRYKVNSMIDVSDGFLLDLYRIMKASDKGAVIDKEGIPVTNGEADLSRGEDYELIFTVSKDDEAAVKRLMKKYYCVGRILPSDRGFFMFDKGEFKPVEAKGYVQF